MSLGQAIFPPDEPPQPPTGGMRVTIVDDHLEVSAVLTNAEAVDNLVKALQATKQMLPPTAERVARMKQETIREIKAKRAQQHKSEEPND